MGAFRETECGVCSRSVVMVRKRSACRKLESAQMRLGKKLLGASNAVAGMVVQEYLGWRKLEERRVEMKVLFGKRLEESQLVKMVVKKLRGLEE